jgi:hypothetical protein
MHQLDRSDRSSENDVKRLGGICGTLLRRDRESGQAMVEFVLVLLPLIIFVGGVIQLGIGIANWHDLNRIANEGARFAAVEEWPGCPAQTGTPTVCNGNPVCHPFDPDDLDGRSLQNFLRCELIDAGLPTGVAVKICQPASATGVIGDPVTVKLESHVNFLGLDGNDRNKASWLGVTLRSQATMRLEVNPTKYTIDRPC